MKFLTKLLVVASTLILSACGETQIYYVYQQPDGSMQELSGPPPALQNVSSQAPDASLQQPAAQQKNSATPAKKTTSTKKTSNATTPTAGNTTQAPVAAPSNSGTLSVEDKLLTKARDAFAKLQTLSATVATYENGKDGEGNGQLKFLFKKPGTVKVEVVKAPDPGQVGVKLAYSDQSTVKVRPSGSLGFVSVSLSMDDQKLLSGRGYKLAQIDLSNTVQRLTKAGTKAKVIGQTQVSGSNVILLEIIPTQHFDSRITREVFGVDMTTYMPRIHEMYQGADKVYGVQVLNINVNAPISASDFEV